MYSLRAPQPAWFLVEVLLVVALAGSLAYWTWVFLAPRAVAPSEGRSVAAAAAAVRPGLFGTGRADGPAASQGAARWRLAGVVAQGGEGGRAIFEVSPGKSVAYAVGDELPDGYRLKSVHADHVVVQGAGAPERRPLERRAAPPPAGSATR